jgi:midasin
VTTSVECDFLVTPTSQRNIESLVLAICRQSPILLLGSSGVGKTATIDYIAKLTGNHGTMTHKSSSFLTLWFELK